MKKIIVSAISAVSLMSFCLFTPVKSYAEVNVSIRVPLPPLPLLVIPAPPVFRHGPVVYERVPYGDAGKNWRARDRDRYGYGARYGRAAQLRHDEGRGRGERGYHEHDAEQHDR